MLNYHVFINLWGGFALGIDVLCGFVLSQRVAELLAKVLHILTGVWNANACVQVSNEIQAIL